MKKTILILSIILGFSGLVYASPIPIQPAAFETYLASPQSISVTNLTLSNGYLRDGTPLTGYVCFTIDTNTPTLEYECGTASTTVGIITGITRGLTPLDGITGVPSLTFPHRRGANVKITDYPFNTLVQRALSGITSLDNPISYTTNPSFSGGNQLINKQYADNLSFAGASIINATAGAKGIVQLATGQQAGSSTAIGSSGASLVLPAVIATSTYNASSSYNVVVTGSNNKIDDNFITGNPIGSITAYASTTPPAGWLLANGGLYATTSYPKLFSVIGYYYGSSTLGVNFAVPNLTGKTIVMASSTQTATSSYDRALMGATGGETIHTQTLAEMAMHKHSFQSSNGNQYGYVIGIGSNNIIPTDITGVPANENYAGNSVPMNVLDPYMILNYIIKF